MGYVYPAGQQPPDTVLYTHEMQAEEPSELYVCSLLQLLQVLDLTCAENLPAGQL
jgi:hypothetical protein